MSIVTQINNDIKKAMLAKEKERLSALRAIKSALLLLATGGGGSEVSDEDAMKAMQKLVKQRNDSARIYHEQDRADMAAEEELQAKVIEEYLPAMMGEDEVRKVVQEKIAIVGATGPSEMGKVMGPIMGVLQGKADGKLISQIVKEELNK